MASMLLILHINAYMKKTEIPFKHIILNIYHFLDSTYFLPKLNGPKVLKMLECHPNCDCITLQQ